MIREERSIEKPILFNTEMVQAILDGRKTVTRRILKLPKHIKEQENGLYTLFADGSCYENQHMEEIVNYIKPPYQKDDTLYVRETWTKLYYVDPDGYTHYDQEMYFYHADGVPDITLMDADGFEEDDQRIRWRPSIHMPKEAARIWLKVADVRVERLHDMTLDDYLAEGVVVRAEAFNDPENAYLQARSEFSRIWDSTIKKSQTDLNPWVWAIEFERCKKPEKIDMW